MIFSLTINNLPLTILSGNCFIRENLLHLCHLCAIVPNKGEYYKLLQDVRKSGNWTDWILYMLKGIEETSRQTILLVQGIKTLMLATKHKIRSELPKIYSQDLLNNLFHHPYTKIDFLMRDLSITRITATKYLNTLAGVGILEKKKIGRSYYYINSGLVELFVTNQMSKNR